MEKMTSRQFCYWLQGAFELKRAGGKLEFSKDQIELIQEKLNLVFQHEIDPSYGDEKLQEALNNIHNPSKIDYDDHDHGNTLVRC